MEALRKRISGFFFKAQPSNLEEPSSKEILDFVEKQQRGEHEKSLDQIRSVPNREAATDSPDKTASEEKSSEEGFHLRSFLGQREPKASNSNAIDYQLEFVNFVERNSPRGFPQKLNDMLPYLGAGFVAWPSFWMWRGYQWKQKRNTERLVFYIQRTYQQAKLLQVAILATGLMMSFTGHHSGNILKVHDVDFKNKQNQDTAKSD